MVLVTPMDPACNRYVHEPPSASGQSACDLARLSVAVWQTEPEVFEQFHDWLMESAEIPLLDAARAQAAELIGAGRLERALAGPAIARQIEADSRLYQVSGEGTIPRLLSQSNDHQRRAGKRGGARSSARAIGPAALAAGRQVVAGGELKSGAKSRCLAISGVAWRAAKFRQSSAPAHAESSA